MGPCRPRPEPSYSLRLNQYRETMPQADFGILRRWGERMANGCGVFTSNVEGHFQRAGFGTNRVAVPLTCPGPQYE